VYFKVSIANVPVHYVMQLLVLVENKQLIKLFILGTGSYYLRIMFFDIVEYQNVVVRKVIILVLKRV
jgi:hypothetical protein